MTDTLTVLPCAREIETALDKAAFGLSAPLQTLMQSLTSVLAEQGGLARDYSHAPLRLLLSALTHPYRLDRREGRFLELQAWCHNNRTVRTFALDRILEARLTEQKFTLQDWNPSDEGVVGGMRDSCWVEVEVLFSAEVAPFARARRWPFKATFEETGDGGVILRGRVQGMEGIVRELLSWRRQATVLGGPELRTRFVEEVRAMADLYPAP